MYVLSMTQLISIHRVATVTRKLRILSMYVLRMTQLILIHCVATVTRKLRILSMYVLSMTINIITLRCDVRLISKHRVATAIFVPKVKNLECLISIHCVATFVTGGSGLISIHRVATATSVTES